MSLAADTRRPGDTDDLGSLPTLAAEAAGAAEQLLAKAVSAARAVIAPDGRTSAALLDREQHRAHGLAWLATYVEAIKQLAAYAERQEAQGRLGKIERLLTQIGCAEYAAQIIGGIPMSQLEIIRLSEIGVSAEDQAAFANHRAVAEIVAKWNTPDARARLIGLISDSRGAVTYGDSGLDETLESMRQEMRRFSDAEIAPYAHEWHLSNSYVPLEVIAKMNELGVFGLTIPEAFGGLGLGKEAMCVVFEELSRGYIGVGSLGTRSEIAAELILCGGTERTETELAAEARLG